MKFELRKIGYGMGGWNVFLIKGNEEKEVYWAKRKTDCLNWVFNNDAMFSEIYKKQVDYSFHEWSGKEWSGK
jgi:hypothetical protein